MFALLAKIFIKDCGQTEKPQVRRAYGMLSGITGILLNILLFAGKYFAGRISGSVAVMADAFNNLSDAGSSLITFLGFCFAGRAADREHPFGHGRIEYISGLGVSVMILLMGIELIKSSAGKIIHPQPVELSSLTAGILIASVCVKLYMFAYNRAYGKRIDSAAMSATAADSLSDAAATLVVLLSMTLQHFLNINIDGWCGILVAAFILYAGYNAAKDTLSPLLGKAPDHELVERIEQIVLAHDEIIGIHDLVVHDYGPGRLMISLHGEVPGTGDIYCLHDAIDSIERELEERLGCQAVIHMDPIAVDDPQVALLQQEVSTLLETIDQQLSLHDFRIVTGPTHTNLIFDVVVPHGIAMTDDELKKTICEKVSDKSPNHFCVIKIDHSYV